MLRVAPTTHSGQVLGLIVAVRPPGGDQFTTDDDTMLTELARQVGLALHNVELDSALQESPRRGPAPGRRAPGLPGPHRGRLRRGPAPDRAQPPRRGPAAPGGAGGQRPPGPQAGRDATPRPRSRSSTSWATDIQDAVQELRALAHGIYPPLLIDRGIAEALRSAAGRAALPTEVEAEGLDRYSPETRGRRLLLLPRGAAERRQARRRRAPPPSSGCGRTAASCASRCATPGRASTANGTAGKGAGFVNMSDRVGADRRHHRACEPPPGRGHHHRRPDPRSPAERSRRVKAEAGLGTCPPARGTSGPNCSLWT